MKIKVLLVLSFISGIGVMNAAIKTEEGVSLSPYQESWKSLYESENIRLKRIFPTRIATSIQHFGSTAVDGMLAKPIIDIIIGLNVYKLDKPTLHELFKLGYRFIEESTYCQRFYLKKRTPFLNVNLTIALYEGDVWNQCISVRDYLLTHPLEVLNYSAVKEEAISLGLGTIDEYSAYKRFYVQELTKRATKWMNS